MNYINLYLYYEKILINFFVKKINNLVTIKTIY